VKQEKVIEYRVEALDAKHDRAGFHCGVPELDKYFHSQAGQDARRHAAACYVLVDKASSVGGYYTLSAYGLNLAELPEHLIKKLPRYPRLPATMLGRLAVSSSFRGQGLGRVLLLDALDRSWKHAAGVASIGVVVHALDDAARQFYLHHEFQPLRDHPNKLLLWMATIQKMFQ
jgi:GNAT superfamily N-acetyltransferase